ncbi:Alpha amylase, catalytic domain containing protein [Tritrichomonas foetus]|uniref:Alpha amylase, catalytic domain containing protein n=1 Tax=Tritrichomonas foetus TaxID=1144522 RepID=A0A1J4L0X0_9EUKA|nr:Alpha amylase, catalytic domain containing protein [Tritrichomonas foetus]|eukprot:OHT17159.1 Alpha amylase, catalytic domain containing protein [Tritrichomonas foetus]
MVFSLSILMATSFSIENPTTLLEITTRPYLYLLSRKYGKDITKISQIPTTEFDEWQSQGFKWVWFMGIWQLGEYGLKHDLTDQGLINSYNEVLPGWTEDDVIGSPYCVVSYTVNSAIGDEDDLKWLRQQLNSRGMKLMVDFVPNHSAVDAPEVESTPSFYIRAPEGTTPDPSKYLSNGVAYGCGMWCSPWTDVAQLNYMDQDFRNNRISVLKKIASLADGMRCDMAHLILNDNFWSYWEQELQSWGYSKLTNEFWTEAISAVKNEYPDCLFMAESYGDVLYQLHQCGFDYTYNKDLMDYLRDNKINEFKSFVQYTDRDYFNHLAHFTENHDEDRSVSTFGSVKRANAAAAALLTLPGLRFVNQDQWNGYSRKIDVHLRRAISENPNGDAVYFLSSFIKCNEERSCK